MSAFANIDFPYVENMEKCESPIEVRFMGTFSLALSTLKLGNLYKTVSITPQFELGRFRYDFAIRIGKRRKKPDILIECDGHEFHSSREQIDRDIEKDELAIKHGITPMRFTGTDIYNRPCLCVDAVLLKIDALRNRRK